LVFLCNFSKKKHDNQKKTIYKESNFMAIFALLFPTTPKPTKQPSPNSTPTPPQPVNYEKKGIELLASFIGDGVQFFETVATKSNENNKKIDQHFQDGLDWLTGINKSTSSKSQDLGSSSCSSSDWSDALTEIETGPITPRSTDTNTFFSVDGISDDLIKATKEINEAKAKNLKETLKNSINNYIETVPWHKKPVFQLSTLVQSIQNDNDGTILKTVATYLNEINKPSKDKLTTEEYKQLLELIIRESKDPLAKANQTAIVNTLLEKTYGII
jgi:hypothetical protein